MTGATFRTLFPWLPAAVQDLNVGIIALAVNLVVLIVVSVATRFATEGHGAPTISRKRGV